ncbi:MAG: YqaA family protein [SAR202 cluster bacterium]|nr:YqaA family protein [SAR202 cluster bacterium]MDP7225837.1 YqaA family protein [SAR202 cluster bacterium]MDP7413694.1 YqaA family protein [SAR202 cluster bacterium]HJO83086.1 YqaA family protein [SAR202 cluster bacterium]
MSELLTELAHWTDGFAQSDWSSILLFLLAFSESIFFPIPPDPLLMAIGIAKPDSAIWLAGLVTVGSVAGAFVGHTLGRKLGRPVLNRFVSDRKLGQAESLFDKFGVWAIIIAAFTPIPYKVFAILAGVMKLPVRPFLIASLIGRGARFFLIGVLIFVFGESIQTFFDDYFMWITIAVGLGIVAIVAATFIVTRARK